MTKRFIFVFVVLALAVANAKTYTVTLFQPSYVAGTELKPGDYRLEVKDAKVVMKSGSTSVEAPVKVEEGDTRYSATTVRYENGDGKYKVREIRLGGTKTRLIFD